MMMMVIVIVMRVDDVRGWWRDGAVERRAAVAQLDGDGRVQWRRLLAQVLLLPVLVEALAPLVRVAAYGAGELGHAVLEHLAVASRIDLRVVVALGLLGSRR